MDHSSTEPANHRYNSYGISRLTHEDLTITGMGKRISRNHRSIQIETRGEKPVPVSPLGLERIILEGDHSLSAPVLAILLEHKVELDNKVRFLPPHLPGTHRAIFTAVGSRIPQIHCPP